MEVRASLSAALLLLGCSEPRPPANPSTPEPSIEAQNPPPTDSAPAASTPEPPPPPTIRLTRTDGLTNVLLVEPLEELLAIPGGVAWTQSGEVWAVLDDADSPTQVAKMTDPHGLTTDGETLIWVGDTENGRWNPETGETTSWDVFARSGQQAGLAFSDALYGQDRMGVWRFDGRDARRMPFRIEPGWRVLGFRAGKDRVVLGVMAMDLHAPTGSKVRKQYVRVRSSGKATIVPTRLKPFRHRWAVSAAGDLAFVRDHAGTIAVLEATRNKAKVVVEGAGVTTLCFCGTELCTVAQGTLRRHAGTTVTTLAETGDTTMLSCTADRVAWSRPVDGRTQITVLPLVGTEGTQSGRE